MVREKRKAVETGRGVKEQLSDILIGMSVDVRGVAGSASQLDRHPDFLDQAAAHRDREVRLRLLKRKSERFYEVQDALFRIENGTYGICTNCGDEIGPARLNAYPTTTLCLECQRDQERCARIRSSYHRTVSSLPA